MGRKKGETSKSREKDEVRVSSRKKTKSEKNQETHSEEETPEQIEDAVKEEERPAKKRARPRLTSPPSKKSKLTNGSALSDDSVDPKFCKQAATLKVPAVEESRKKRGRKKKESGDQQMKKEDSGHIKTEEDIPQEDSKDDLVDPKSCKQAATLKVPAVEESQKKRGRKKKESEDQKIKEEDSGHIKTEEDIPHEDSKDTGKKSASGKKSGKNKKVFVFTFLEWSNYLNSVHLLNFFL